MIKFRDFLYKIKLWEKKLLIFLFVSLIVLGVYIYNSTNYIIIRFNELGPLTKNMSAYYNGFKIGYITKISPDDDFKHIIVKVRLFQKDINLPQNITAYVERFPTGELYLQFLYPQSPSLRLIKRGDMVEGISQSSVEQFMLGQNVSGMTDIVSIHVIKALNATEIANHEMKVFFQNTSKLIEENRASIKASVNNTEKMTKNLAQMAQNLNQTTKKINDSLDAETIRATTINVKDSTSYIKTSTENIANATKDLDKTVKKIDDTIVKVNESADNINSITAGINETLGKKFAGMRILFGTAVPQKSSQRNACK